MLVITRKPGDWFQIGDDVKVYFLDNRGNQMRIGIDAPRDVKILRGELVEEDQDDDPR